ncbi:MAG: lipopolysaccharide biosynthesis protein [Prevotella sp.]|nr:lipopolysaccharide biosynthesis protein [Prevotella sp.]
MNETLKDKTAKGLLWGGINNGVQQLVGLVFGIILGRLLSRDDFGMIAMITIFSLIANELQSSGFKTGLVNMKSPRHEDYNAVFWFNVLAASIIYLILFLCSPLIAAYYHQPALTWLCRYVFLGFVFSSFGMAQSAYLTKNLHIKQIAQSGMTAVVLSSITGAGLAWLGFSYWALATQSLVYILTNTLLLWHFSPWRPTFSFNFDPVRRLFPFSVKILITAILQHVNVNVMNIMLGRHYSARDTGDYNQAYQWSSKCFLLVQNMLKQVDQPVLAGLHDERERQLHVLRKMMRFTAFISFPMLFGLGLVSHEFIVLTIGEKWVFSASLLPWLCLSGAFMPLSTLLADMIVSRGRSDIYMWCTLGLGCSEIVLMATLWPYGIRTMVYAFVAVSILWTGVWFCFVSRLTGYRTLSFLKDTVPFALAASGVMAATRYLTAPIASLWLLLAARVAVAAALYYVVMRLAGTQILAECQQFVTSRFRKK